MQENLNLNQVLAKINECNEKLEELKNLYDYYENQNKYYEEKLNTIGIPQDDYKRYSKEIATNRKKQQKCNDNFLQCNEQKAKLSELRDNLVNVYYEILNNQNALEEEKKKDKDIMKEIFLAIKEENYEKATQITKEKADIVSARHEKMKELEARKEEILNGSGIILNIKEEQDVEEKEEEPKIEVSKETNVEEVEENIENQQEDKTITDGEFFDNAFADIPEKVENPNDLVNETGEYKAEQQNEPEHKEEKKKHGVLETMKAGAEEVKDRAKAGLDAIKNGKLDLNPEEKKRPKFIKNITDWVKNHKAVMGIAVGAIAVALIAGGPIAALASTAGEAAAGYVAYKSTMGKGR